MSSLPLHPAIVHLPLGLAFIIPLLAIGFAWALRKGRVRPRAWLAIVALQAILLGAGMVAMNTGEREEERVEAVVPDAALEQHERLAGQFVWATAGTLVLALLVLVFRGGTIARALTLATAVASVLVAAAAIRVGRAGGELVYRHNAGAAYSTTTQRTATADNVGVAPRRDRHRDDR